MHGVSVLGWWLLISLLGINKVHLISFFFVNTFQGLQDHFNGNMFDRVYNLCSYKGGSEFARTEIYLL